MQVADKRVHSKSGKRMFIGVMIFLALTGLNKIWPASTPVIGKLLGAAVAYGLFGFALSMLVDWLLFRWFFRRTIAIAASCIASLPLLSILAWKQPKHVTFDDKLIGLIGTVLGLGLVLVIRLRAHKRHRAILEQLIRVRPEPQQQA